MISKGSQIEVRCPQCEEEFCVPDIYIGRSVRCSKCNCSFVASNKNIIGNNTGGSQVFDSMISKENQIKVRCPQCEEEFYIPDIYIGRAVKCSKCDRSLVASSKNIIDVESLAATHNTPDTGIYYSVEDRPDAIRFNSNYPEWLLHNYQLIEDYAVAVAGTSHRPDSVNAFIKGRFQEIEIVKAPQPKYPHAIAVFGTWTGSLGKIEKEQIGYIPDEEAREIAKILKKNPNYIAEGKLAIIYPPTKQKNPGLRIDIGIFGVPVPTFYLEGISKKTGRKRKRHYIASDEEAAIKKAAEDDIIVDAQSIRKIPKDK